MQAIRQDGKYSYLYSRYAPVVATVEPGELFAMYTEDAYSGVVKDESDKPDQIERPGPNPQTGPIYVNGAKPGDALVVRIHSIEPARDYGISQISPLFGGLQGTKYTAMVHPPLESVIFKYVIDGDKIYHPRYSYLSLPSVKTRLKKYC